MIRRQRLHFKAAALHAKAAAQLQAAAFHARKLVEGSWSDAIKALTWDFIADLERRALNNTAQASAEMAMGMRVPHWWERVVDNFKDWWHEDTEGVRSSRHREDDEDASDHGAGAEQGIGPVAVGISDLHGSGQEGSDSAGDDEVQLDRGRSTELQDLARDLLSGIEHDRRRHGKGFHRPEGSQ